MNDADEPFLRQKANPAFIAPITKISDHDRRVELNPFRAPLVAAVIPDGARILDLGAGSMVLKSYLKTHCTYIPADIYDRGEGCIVVDLNKYEFPDASYD